MLRQATAQEVPVEQKIFNEAWKMLKEYRYITMCGSDEEWMQLIERVRSLYTTGTGSPHLETLAKGISIVIFNYLEQVSKINFNNKEACTLAKSKQQQREAELRSLLKII